MGRKTSPYRAILQNAKNCPAQEFGPIDPRVQAAMEACQRVWMPSDGRGRKVQVHQIWDRRSLFMPCVLYFCYKCPNKVLIHLYIYIDSLCRRKESKCKIHGNVVLVTARVRLVVKMFSFAALGCPTVGGALEEAFRTFLVETTETTSQKRHSNWLVHCSSMFQQCAPRTSSE